MKLGAAWPLWIVFGIALWFLVGVAAMLAINAWKQFVQRRPEVAVACGATAIVALWMVGVFAEAVI